MEQEVLVPDIGDYNNVEVIEVAIKEGEHLKKDATMITLETDKATMDIPAPIDLKVNKVQVKPGDRVSKGSLIAMVTNMTILDATELGRKSKRDQTTFNIEPEQSSLRSNIEQQHNPEQVITSGLRGFAYANPSVKKFARELGVNLDNVVGTNKHGRIGEEDIKNYVNRLINDHLINPNASNPNIDPKLNSNKNVDPDFSKWGEIHEKSLSRIKKKSGQHLHKNWLSIPHVTHFDNADITALEQFRKDQQQLPAAKDLKITLLVFLIKAVVAALKTYPNFNSSLSVNGENLIIKKYYNIGIAVDTEAGLVVPVVKNADLKSAFELADELGSLSLKARDNKLTAEDMQGGCFTISSLGGISGYGFTPIINAPEVAILGVSRHKLTPSYINKELEPRLILPFSLSYDHRVIDGAEAAKFCKYIVEQLEDLKNFYA